MNLRFARLSLMVAALVVTISSVSLAQGPGGPGGFGGRGPGGFGGPGGPGGFGGGGDEFGLLMNPQVREDLEIPEAQFEEIQEIMTSVREKMREVFQGMGNFRDMTEEERTEFREKMQAKMAEVQAEVKADLEEVLLPHQLTRLKQIALQQQVARGGGPGGGSGAANALTSDKVAELLGLTEEQLAELREKREEVAQELREKLLAAQKEAEEKLLSVLTPEQQAKWKELLGEPYELQFRGFGGRGGQNNRPGQNNPPAGDDSI
ncbi:hypothetical protein LOC68_01055 [Blastopirellula sp. JC732]|uniref:Periplasmic heavy metal sensor n=1 Tax=Blastopirellula sediminis TaxID=2894196 RepID=A0A9X1SEP4_9BACT|nr:hypothetical protein [Blastopirellula sediminis]MCC9608225.1 hypothetical protein [Blastopirellula sediminis]MCC9626982.1 hypothetical protein [Blastopirellula sediminis]